MRDPRKYCLCCGSRYGIADEYCEHCGFEPIGVDEAEQEAAIKEYDNAER
jgi:hypothetical protein